MNEAQPLFDPFSPVIRACVAAQREAEHEAWRKRLASSPGPIIN